jgi:hypothetical protein
VAVSLALAIALAVVVRCAALLAGDTAHPLHMSFAGVTFDPAARAVTVSLRVFADDFSADVARRTRAPVGADGMPPDEAVFRYVTARFAVVTARGDALAFRWCGARRTGAQLEVCLRAPASAVPTGARVRNAILSEAFGDQVNVVQISFGGRRQTLFFTPGDGAKVI